MAWRFRRSMGFGPFRVTATKRGFSVSGGGPLGRISLNTRGEVRKTTRVPGVGLYNTRKVAQLGGPVGHTPSHPAAKTAAPQVQHPNSSHPAAAHPMNADPTNASHAPAQAHQIVPDPTSAPPDPPHLLLPKAGWYVAPDDPTRWRWWDGGQWSEHYSPPLAIDGAQSPN